MQVTNHMSAMESVLLKLRTIATFKSAGAKKLTTKHTEVNPMGFTIVVEENGHNPNHSYYDIK